MRVDLPGVAPNAASIHFEFETPADGARGPERHLIAARPGETLAAALTTAGHWELCQSHLDNHTKRDGLYCGMGVCANCLVQVNGERRRACMEAAADGLRVKQYPSRISVAETPPAKALPETEIRPDLLVIGAGPAGLSAARAAAASGLDVVLVDERRSAGGQYYKQPNAGCEINEAQLDEQFRAGRKLIAATLVSGVRYFKQATTWGIFGPLTEDSAGRVGVITPEARLTIFPRRLIIATGAYERSVPCPGWDLPRVMTTGAAQTLLRSSRVLPGERVLIGGNGPLNLQVAREMAEAGADIVAVLEAADAPGPRALPPLLRMLASAPHLVAAGREHLRVLESRGIPLFYRHAVSRIEPGLKLTVSRLNDEGHPVAGTDRVFAVDSVCLGYGFVPQTELARAAGCAHEYDARRGILAVTRDEECRTTVPSVFVAGDSGGLGGAHAAMSQGTIAGLAAVRDLRGRVSSAALSTLAEARRLLAKHRRFQSALWQLYRAPLLTDQLADNNTRICRCEGVTKAQLIELAAKQMGLAAIKQETRAGMGRCQGRYCSVVMPDVIRRYSEKALTERDLLAPRPPFRPALIGSLIEPTALQALAQQERPDIQVERNGLPLHQTRDDPA